MIIYDIAFVAGAGCLGYAGYQIHPAVAWAIAGVSLIVFGWAGAARKLKTKGQPK